MKKDNKGFSLVELIIVIAIMAILVGIVGSQVLPYLNKSREAKDQQIISGWVTAALSAYSANAATLTGTSYTLTIDTSNKTIKKVTASTANDGDVLESAFSELTAIPRHDATSAGSNKFSSKLYQDITSVVLLVTPTDTTYVVRIQSIGGLTAPQTISTTELVAK